MTTREAVESLFDQLSALTRALDKLSVTLKHEQNALTQDDYSTLETLARDKETLSAQIDQLEQHRHTLCQQLGIRCDYDGIKTYLASVSGKLLKRLETQWAQISELGEDCASQNQINGMLVANQHRHTCEALAILRGVSNNDAVYSASGSATSATESQHSLGRV